MGKKYNNNSNIDFIFTSELRKTVQGSKQVEEMTFSSKTIEYKGTSPAFLSILRKGAFLIKSPIKKVSTASNTKLMSKDNQDMAKSLEKIKNILVLYGTENIFTSGNAWFEVIRNGKNEVTNLVPFITETIRLLQGGEGAVQAVGKDEVFYNIFEPDEKERKEKEKIFKETGAKKDELVPKKIKGRWRTGYNKGLNEVILVKNVNIDDKYYGESIIEEIADQAILLKRIDQYFDSFFERGTIKTVLIFDKGGKDGKSTLKPEEKKIIKEEFTKKTSGVKNSFSALIVSANLDHIILDSDVDPDSFVKYREKLRQDILAGMNIPYEIMYSDTSGRNSMKESRQIFSDYAVQPNQELFVAVLIEISKTLTSDNKGDDSLFLPTLDTGNNLEEIKALSEAVKSGWMTPNDARTNANYDLDEVLAGDVLYVPSGKTEQDPEEVPENLDDVI